MYKKVPAQGVCKEIYMKIQFLIPLFSYYCEVRRDFLIGIIDDQSNPRYNFHAEKKKKGRKLIELFQPSTKSFLHVLFSIQDWGYINKSEEVASNTSGV